MNQPSLPELSAPAPAFWQRRPQLMWGLAVFGLTAGLTYAAFPPIGTGEAAYAMLLPAVLWAYRKPDFKAYATAVLGAQVVAWIGLLAWLHHVSWFGMVALGTLSGLLNGLWFLAVWWYVPRLTGHRVYFRLLALLGLAGLWVMGEWLRGVIFGGFPWLPLAASQWQRPLLLQVASVGGAWVVSYVLVCFNLGAAAYAHRIFYE
ncbi:MAG: apolipoprotein N-acyltransferase, partial [Candidatus Didemnitutus sp.]|nr:apolipoprotein N-acyltransferase [Candidatus Didemnitutus sp.]